MSGLYASTDKDLDPATAQLRIDHFKQRLAVAEEFGRLQMVSGARKQSGRPFFSDIVDTHHYYERLLQAQIDFAEAQLREAEEAKRSHRAAGGRFNDDVLSPDFGEVIPPDQASEQPASQEAPDAEA